MPHLAFSSAGVTADRYAASPTLLFALKVAEESGLRVHSLSLRIQLRIEPTGRRYDDDEARALLDLFGERSRWGTTLKPLQFANVSVAVPGFSGSTTVEVPVPCSYDFDVAAAKYFQALHDGEIPLLLLFSGTLFYHGNIGDGGGVQVDQVPWDREVRVRLPVSTWREVMDLSFPGTAWMRVRTETLDALQHYKSARALTSWDEAIEALIAGADGDRT